VGFEAPETAYKLNFAGTELDGLEVTVRELSIGDFLKLTTLAGAAEDPAAAAQGADEMFRTLAGALVSWNLERDGEPVPTTYDGVTSYGLGFMMKIVSAWLSAMSDVTPPLPGGSSSGATSGLEQSIPMAPLSPSRGS